MSQDKSRSSARNWHRMIFFSTLLSLSLSYIISRSLTLIQPHLFLLALTLYQTITLTLSLLLSHSPRLSFFLSFSLTLSLKHTHSFLISLKRLFALGLAYSSTSLPLKFFILSLIFFLVCLILRNPVDFIRLKTTLPHQTHLKLGLFSTP